MAEDDENNPTDTAWVRLGAFFRARREELGLTQQEHRSTVASPSHTPIHHPV